MKMHMVAVSVVLVFAALAACQQKDASRTSLPRSSRVTGENISELQRKAEVAREADQIPEAIRLYKQLVQLKPGSVEYWWYLGSLYYESDQYPEGQTAFRRVTGLKPEMSLGWAMLGLCEFETKDYERALVHLSRADDLKIPKQGDYYDVAKYHLALLLIRSAQFELAVQEMIEFLQSGKETPQFTEAMGLAGLRKPLLPKELPATEREVILDVGRAMCDSAERRADAVENDIRELLAKYPNVSQIHYMIGAMLLSSDPDRALSEFKAELEVSPSHPQALVAIAQEYFKRGQFESALPYAEKAIKADSGYFTAHAVLGQILADGNLDVARGIRELQTAVRLAPNQPQVHFALGTAYVRAGRKEDAAKERAEFLRLRGQK